MWTSEVPRRTGSERRTYDSHVSARRHLSVHLGGEAAIALDEMRVQWDPKMAKICPPHITLVYPEEVIDEDVLIDRATRLVPRIRPFDVVVREVIADDEGRGGVFVAIEDRTGQLTSLRESLLTPPQRPVGYPFHSTIAHPRTSPDPVACWQRLRGVRLNISVRIDEILHTSTDDTARSTLATFRLGQASEI